MSIWKSLFGGSGRRDEPERAPAPAGPPRTLEGGSRRYEEVMDAGAFARAIVERKPVFIEIPFAAVGETFQVAVRALPAGFDKGLFDYRKHLRFICTTCQSALSPEGLGVQLLSYARTSSGDAKKACRACAGATGRLLFHSEGFIVAPISVAHYFIYDNAAKARAGFAAMRAKLTSVTIPVHGKLELRESKEGVNFPHWVVLYFPKIERAEMDAFISALESPSRWLDAYDWEMVANPTKISHNQANSVVLETMEF